MRQTKTDLLFYGHSVLARYPKNSVGDYSIDNFGISGTLAEDGYKNILLENKIKADYDYILIMFGINELGNGFGVGHAAHYLSLAVTYFAENFPNAQMILSQVMHGDEESTIPQALVSQLNDEIQTIASKKSLPMFQWDAFYDDHGFVLPEYSTDGIHLSDAGYRLFETELVQLVDSLKKA